MTTAQTPRWYCVNNMGMATLCADQADAEDVARTCDMEWPRQGPHRAAQLVEAPKIHYPMAEPVAWMWRVADSDWQLESTCPPERPLAIVEPLYTGYMADAYIGAREEVEIWKRRALEAEKKLQAEIARLTAENEALKAVVPEAVAAEREACAKACESSANGFGEETLWAAGYVQGVRDVADGIRARGEHDAI